MTRAEALAKDSYGTDPLNNLLSFDDYSKLFTTAYNHAVADELDWLVRTNLVEPVSTWFEESTTERAEKCRLFLSMLETRPIQKR